MKTSKTLLAVIAAIAMTGCATQDMGTIGGGVVGGAIGSQFGKGNGKTAATILGTGVGAVVGNRVFAPPPQPVIIEKKVYVQPKPQKREYREYRDYR